MVTKRHLCVICRALHTCDITIFYFIKYIFYSYGFTYFLLIMLPYAPISQRHSILAVYIDCAFFLIYFIRYNRNRINTQFVINYVI